MNTEIVKTKNGNLPIHDVSVELPISKQNEFLKRLKQFCDENELTSIPTNIAMPTIINYLFENYNIDIKGN